MRVVYVTVAIVFIPVFFVAELLGFVAGFTADAFMRGWHRTDFNRYAEDLQARLDAETAERVRWQARGEGT